VIARLRGHLLEKSPEGLVVEAGGIGFGVTVTLTTLYGLPEPGSEVDLLIHTHVRENNIQLIGFLSRRERDAFRALLTVSGIGPRLAITILSGIEVKDFHDAIIQQDMHRLHAVPGVGKKLAERIVVELKDKIPSKDLVIAGTHLGPGKDRQHIVDVLSAMMNLGYKRMEAEKAIQWVLEKEFKDREVRLEELLKASLRRLMRDPHQRVQ